MKSATTKPNRYGWYYTFRKRKDGTIVVYQKRKRPDGLITRDSVYIYGEEELEAFYQVVLSEGE